MSVPGPGPATTIREVRLRRVVDPPVAAPPETNASNIGASSSGTGASASTERGGGGYAAPASGGGLKNSGGTGVEGDEGVDDTALGDLCKTVSLLPGGVLEEGYILEDPKTGREFAVVGLEFEDGGGSGGRTAAGAVAGPGTRWVQVKDKPWIPRVAKLQLNCLDPLSETEEKRLFEDFLMPYLKQKQLSRKMLPGPSAQKGLAAVSELQVITILQKRFGVRALEPQVRDLPLRKGRLRIEVKFWVFGFFSVVFLKIVSRVHRGVKKKLGEEVGV